MKRIRVAIDASPLLLRSAGVKTYVYHWSRSLIAQAGQNQVTLFPYLDGRWRFTHEGSVVGPLATAARLAVLHSTSVPLLPILDWLLDCDLFHANHVLPRPPRKIPFTTTLYDMTGWVIPEAHKASTTRATRRIAERLFRPAQAIIAISESARSDALRILDLKPEKIVVIHPGVADGYFAANEADARRVTGKFHLSKPYVLFVGTVEPRKNLHTLLDAWEGLRKDLKSEFELVVAGAWGWGDSAILRRLQAGAAGIRYLGYVDEADLPGLTAGADAFAYPSLYEGFGLPLAQAMAAGVASVTSNISSMPEVAGDAALLVDPRSVAELRAALEELLESPALRAELGERARERAARFTWTESARQTWELFQKITA